MPRVHSFIWSNQDNIANGRMYHRAMGLDKQVGGEHGGSPGMSGCEWRGHDDGNRSVGFCGRNADDLRLLAPAAEDLDLEVRRRCLAGDVGNLYGRRLPLVSLWAGASVLADYFDQCGDADTDGGDIGAQDSLSD